MRLFETTIIDAISLEPWPVTRAPVCARRILQTGAAGHRPDVRVDPRLNAFFPNVLALPAEEFISRLRNAGNLITGQLSSTMRSLALACAVKGGREIAIIGHTDCQICKTTTIGLLDKLKAVRRGASFAARKT